MASAAAPSVTTEAASSVKATEATLNGKVNPEGSATGYWFEYGATTSYGTKIPISPKSIGSGASNVAVSQTPTGLKEGTTYHYRAVAENAFGTTYGADKTFTPLQAPMALTHEALGLKTNGAILRGSVYYATSYFFEYGKTTAYGTKVPVPAKEAGAGGYVIEPLNGLAESTTYHYRTVAQNEGGTAYGEDQTLTTTSLPKAPAAFWSQGGKALSEGKGHAIAVEGKGLLSLSFVGYENQCEVQMQGSVWNGSTTGEGEIDSAAAEGCSTNFGCEIEAVTTDGFEGPWPLTATKGEAHVGNIELTIHYAEGCEELESMTVTGILHGNLNNESGCLEFSEAGEFQLFEYEIPATVDGEVCLEAEGGVPALHELPKATTEAAGSVKATEATLNGKVNPKGSATGYWFEYGTTTSYGTKIPISPKSVGSGTSDVAVSQTPTGLTDNTTYHYRVVAENEGGTTFGGDKTLTTLKAPPKVTTTAPISVKETEATLTALVNPKGSATGYWFEYGATTSYGTKIPTSAKSIGSGTISVFVTQTPTGLKEGTTYHYRVVAENEIGTTYGADKTFTPLKAPIATTYEASGLKTNGAILRGRVENATSYWFEYGTTFYVSKVPVPAKEISPGGDPNVIESLNGLAENTTYHYRTVAKNDGGIAYGEDQTLTTTSLPKAPAAFWSQGGKALSEGKGHAIAVEGKGSLSLSFVGYENQCEVQMQGSVWNGSTTGEGEIDSAVAEGCSTSFGCEIEAVTTDGFEGPWPLTATKGEAHVGNIELTIHYAEGCEELPLSITVTGILSGNLNNESGCLEFSEAGEFQLFEYELPATVDGEVCLEAEGGAPALHELPKATTEAAGSVVATEATLNGKVNPKGSAAGYWFEYGTTTSYGTKIPISPKSVGSGTSDVAVSQTPYGLTANTTYHYRVVAENEGGTTYGGDKTLTTPSPPVWSLQKSSESGENSRLNQVSCSSATACMAVGISSLGSLYSESWNGESWTSHSMPSEGSVAEGTVSVDCTTASACIAVVGNPGGSWTESWDGSKWTMQSETELFTGIFLEDVSCGSAGDCFAVGYEGFVEPVIAHWNGSKWSLESVTLPPEASEEGLGILEGVSCDGENCMAVGVYVDAEFQLHTLAESWNGSEWTPLELPIGGNLGFNAVSCTAGECTVVTTEESGPYAAHWNGSKWSIQSLPVYVQDISCASAGSCVAVGYSNGPAATAAVWNGSKWTEQSLPEPEGATGTLLSGVSCSSALVCTAVGQFYAGSGSQSLIYRYQ